MLTRKAEVAKKGVGLRGFGQKILEMLGDKKVHPNAAIPGGMNKALSPENREEILHLRWKYLSEIEKLV